jgi:hypothetical protein
MMEKDMFIYRSKWFGIGLFLVLFAALFTSSQQSYAATRFEQHINILDTTFSTTSPSTALPATNDLGLIRYDSDRFTGKTIYFEAVASCSSCSGGNTQATVSLYDSSGNVVTNSPISTNSTTLTRIRSSAITNNLTDDTDYTARVTLDAESGTATLKAARLIIVQSADTLTNTETQIEIGNNTTTSNTNYEVITAPKLFRYQTTDYAPRPSVYFEASLQSGGVGGTAYAVLTSSSDCSSTVSGSEVTIATTTWGRARSASISLANDTTYFVCIKTSAGTTANIANAKIILDQTISTGVSRVTLYHQLINTSVNDTDSTYTAQSFPMQFTPANNTGGIFNYFFETDALVTGNTGYARLFNSTNSSAITDSEISSNQTSFTRIRSTNLSSTLPTSAATLDTELKNSSSDTTIASASFLITQYTAYPSLSFTISAVPSNTATNGITTNIASEISKLDFGYLVPSVPKYIAHKLNVKSTTTSGYVVYTKFLYSLQGLYPANIIEAFPESWSAPASWYSPTGTTANINTGWIGANTSDTRVPNWSSASGKFGGLSTVNVKVMESTDVDAGTDAYVTYAMEINDRQPTDTYIGTLVYNVTATY